MIRHIFLLFVFGLTSSLTMADVESASYARNTTVAETTGVLSGMTIGGMVGGPPGIIAGAAIGALLGDGWNAKRRVNDLQVSLYESQLRLAMLQEESDRLQDELAAASRESSREIVTPSGARIIPANLESPVTRICCDNTVVSVHFRTGSSSIENHDQEILDSFANLSRQLPDPAIEIVGYADRNGDAGVNLQLSQRRSEAVKTYLASLGIRNASVTTIAHGESRPVQANQNLETDFFDRRVILRLRDSSQLMLSQRENNQ
ncbi:MAG: OmpA family protein [Pseudohongiellaceae bacterium]